MGAMRQLWSFIVCLVLSLGLGLAEAPQPCHGDGHGGACQAATCHCDGTCTCKLEHEHDRLVAEVTEASLCLDGTMSAQAREARARLAASCHDRGHGPKFGLPLKSWIAELPTAPLSWRLIGERDEAPGHLASPTSRPNPPPLKPPAILA